MKSDPVIKIEVVGEDVEALARTLVDLAAKVAPQSAGGQVSEDMPLDELLSIVRSKAAEQGYKLLVVKADAEQERAPVTEDAARENAAQHYEPKAVKRRGRRSKAEIEAAEAAAKAALTDEPEETAEEQTTGGMVLWTENDEKPADEDEELSEEQLEAIKKDTIKRLMPIYKTKDGPARVAELLKDYKQYASVSTIPAKFFPEISRRIEA